MRERLNERSMKTGLSNLTLRGLISAASLVFTFYLGDHFGLATLGNFNGLQQVIFWLRMIFGVAFFTYGMRVVHDDNKDDAKSVLLSHGVLQLLLFVPLFLLLFVRVRTIGDAPLFWPLALTLVGIVSTQLENYLIALNHSGEAMATLFCRSALWIYGVFIAGRFHAVAGFIMLLAIWFFFECLAAVYLFFRTWHLSPQIGKPRFLGWGWIQDGIKVGLHYTMIGAMTLALSSTAPLILIHFKYPAASGALYALLGMFTALGTLTSSFAIVPRMHGMLESFAKGEYQRFKSIGAQAARLSLLLNGVGLPFSIVMTVVVLRRYDVQATGIHRPEQFMIAIGGFASSIAQVPYNCLYVMRKDKILVAGNLVAVLACVVISWFGTRMLGPFGACIGVLVSALLQLAVFSLYAVVNVRPYLEVDVSVDPDAEAPTPELIP
jgi:O-antigen/teichoic acid export membrane protein